MESSCASKRQGVSRFMSLPAEIRRQIYRFAIVEPHPLPLILHDTGSCNTYSVEKDLRMLDTLGEFRTEMEDFLYSENSFSYSIRLNDVEKETETFHVDLRRIQKCYISVDCMTEWDGDQDNEPQFFCDAHHFYCFVAELVFEGHQLKYLLVECDYQVREYLAEGLSPLSMLRNIRSVHFRSRDARMYRYFRFLEGLMMGDQPIPFNDLTDFWENSENSYDGNLLRYPEESWLVGEVDTETSVVVKSEEQMEATAKELYTVLRMKGNFIPQSELDDTCFSDKAGCCTY